MLQYIIQLLHRLLGADRRQDELNTHYCDLIEQMTQERKLLLEEKQELSVQLRAAIERIDRLEERLDVYEDVKNKNHDRIRLLEHRLEKSEERERRDAEMIRQQAETIVGLQLRITELEQRGTDHGLGS